MKLNKVLNWMGTIIAGVAAIAYLAIIFILINGFTAGVENTKLFIFLLLGAIDGVLISGSLRFQGVTFAKTEEANVAQIKEYTELRGKSKSVKLYPIWIMYVRSTIIDIIFKGGSLLATMYFTVSIMLEGMKDGQYFVLGIVNVLMFIGLGFMGLAKGYNHYQENQVPYLQQKIDQLKEEKANELLSKVTSTTGQGLRESGDTRTDSGRTDQERLVEGSTIGSTEVTGTAPDIEE